MGSRGWCVVPVLVCTFLAEPSLAKPERKGFTGDLGIGAALTTVTVSTITLSCSSAGGCTSTEGSRSETLFGLAPLSLSLGGFVNPDLAILFRIAGTSYFESGDQLGHNFYGPVLEGWLGDRFFLSGGAGLALFGPNPLVSDSNVRPVGGWALDLRVGAALVNARHNDFVLSIEVIPGFYEEDTVMGYGLIGGWKWY